MTHTMREAEGITLPIVPVLVTAGGREAEEGIETCALLDSGSTRSFCSRRIVERLGLRERRESTVISTLLNQDSRESACVDLKVSGLFSRRHVPLHLTDVIVVEAFPAGLTETKADPRLTAQWAHLQDLASIHRQAAHLSVEMLFGQDAPLVLTPLEVRRGRDGEPFAVRTKLGWAINGPLKPTGEKVMSFSAFIEETTRTSIPDPVLEEAMKQFWEVEDRDEADRKGRSLEDQQVLTLWRREGLRVTGHHQFPIPFREEEPSMPDNMSMAFRRLTGLKIRLSRDEALKARYVKEMEDLISKGYAEEVTEEKGSLGKTWYLPHHPVFNPKKPEKTRIVFDCAARFKGVALNKQVMQGPTLMNDLLGVLIRFREGKVGLSADIEAMFHQVLVDPKDRDALRFLWWPRGDFTERPVLYRMTRHLFGGVWSPSCAAFALQETLAKGRSASIAATRNFYVDDLLLPTNSVREAVQSVRQLQEDLKRGGFHLTKWMSNSKEVMALISQQERSTNVKNIDLASDRLPIDRALGVLWNLEDDSLRVAVTTLDKPVTKRGILSTMSSVFDPLGFMAPFTIRAKMIFQDEVRRREGWDDKITKEAEELWTTWLNELAEMERLHIARCIFSSDFGELVSSQFHHFCDASTKAYAVVTYVRLQDDVGNVHTAFIKARARLAPIKATSIPRLELCAAVLAAGADAQLRRESSLSVEKSVFWTDSMIVLQYIATPSRRFHTFVANRLGTIHRLSSPRQWRHVKSEDNPADDATRGLTARELLAEAGRRWSDGPGFLRLPEDSWPLNPCTADDLEGDPELKREATTLTIDVQHPGVVERLLARYSSWYILKRSVAWLRRFGAWIMTGRPSLTGSPLKVTEIQEARTAIIAYVQRTHFQDAIESLQKGTLTKKNSLYRLEPRLDEQGVLRVGGRRIDEEDEARDGGPALLPRDHPVTTLVVRDVHVFLAKHCGREHTLAMLRRHYWIVAGRPLIDRILRACLICRRVNSKPLTQRQGELPIERISAGKPPFTYTGVDCFGPFAVTCMRRTLKRYGCVFTCFSCRAVHIEVLDALDADAFINALMRFIARRGTPEKLFSDRGTNFQRANKDIRAATRDWHAHTRITDTLQRRDIEWVFQPPAASHMGGVWERQIRSIRKILSSVIGTQRIDDDRLRTLFCEVEATLNSRPLTAAPSDASDPEALTPDHLLRVGAGIRLPLEDLSTVETFRRRWTHAQALADRFWLRWKAEYLHTLRMRQRQIAPTRNLRAGDLVLITDPLLPRNRWRLGRVTKVFPGPDGLVRKARVHTASGDLLRPVVKLCLLEGDVDPPTSTTSLAVA